MLNNNKKFALQPFFKNMLRFGVSGIAISVLAFGQIFPDKAAAKDKAEFVIKYATIAPDNTPWSNHMMRLKKQIEGDSKGRIKMKVFLGGALGGEVEMIRSLRRGRIQGFGGSTAAVAEGIGIPELQLLELPYLFDSLEESDYILDHVVFKDFQKILKEKGFYLAFWHENGWRNFAASKVEVHTPDDLRKLKMRSQESSVHLAMWKALGVQAESIAVPEVLGALKTGMVDGFDNTPLFASATGWYEGVDHYIISKHIYQPAIILYSLKFIDSLPEDLKKIVIGDPMAEMAWGRKAVREMTEPLLQNFRDEGIKVYELTEEEKDAFRKLTFPVHKEFESIVGKELLEKVYAAKKEFALKKEKK
ncbi:MAG: TRAP transporter substrate-binding protein [Deltaproteobacteria bacterium]|nr:TRAP transporter substrate-binding protein [Deltaproteobacteria bacterium]